MYSQFILLDVIMIIIISRSALLHPGRDAWGAGFEANKGSLCSLRERYYAILLAIGDII